MKPNKANSDQAMSDEEFWLKATEVSLGRIWNTPDDDVYAELLDSNADQEFTLNDLLAGMTRENRHPEVDFGHPVGKEKL
jgi:antitoxin component of MazEF toxin-antitoxin module